MCGDDILGFHKNQVLCCINPNPQHLLVSPPHTPARPDGASRIMSHTFTHRLNALLTFAVTVLAVMCFCASVTDEFHVSNPVVDVQVLEIERFTAVDGNDEAYLVFSIDADLTSVFSWNTKQLFVSVQAEYEVFGEDATPISRNVVSIWDRVVESKTAAIFSVPRARNKYKLKARGQHLRGQPVRITVQWNKMPIAGVVRSEKIAFPGITFPGEYTPAAEHETHQRRPGQRSSTHGNSGARRKPVTDNAMPHSAPQKKPTPPLGSTSHEL